MIATWTNPYPSGAGVAVGGYTPNGVIYDFKTPYTQQWSAGVERVVELELTDGEKAGLDSSSGAVKVLIDACKKLEPKLA